MTNDRAFKASRTSRLAIPGESYSLADSPRSLSPDIPIHTPPSESSVDQPPKRRPSPLSLRPPAGPPATNTFPLSGDIRFTGRTNPKSSSNSDADSEDEDLKYTNAEEMDRPTLHRPTGGRSEQPLLHKEEGESRGRAETQSASGSARPPFVARRSTFRSRSPDYNAQSATKRKYIYAAFFLLLSLISFVVQTETAKYVTQELHWEKSYCMLWMTHGSWTILWPMTLLILRIQKRKMPWPAFWRRHKQILRTTAQMVWTRDLHLTGQNGQRSPIPYMLRTTAIVTTALTVAGASWYVAILKTTTSDLTAIYNCSAFFAYAFSIPILKDKFRWDKVGSVAVAIGGVLIIAYGDAPAKGSKPEEAENRALGNVIIGIGSVLYGLYEVMYKRMACPPDGCSPGRGMIFAMTFGSLIGFFTLTVLWIPLPILHFTGLETFEWPTGQAGVIMLISVIANATFSGSFLVLISLTSPVLSSVAALLTIFLVAIYDTLKPDGEPLSVPAIIGGVLIIGAFLLLSWSTYREMEEQRRHDIENEAVFDDDDEDEEAEFDAEEVQALNPGRS